MRAAGTGGNTMSEYEIRSVGGHVEVYTRGGVPLLGGHGAGGHGGAGRGRMTYSRQFPEACQERTGKVQM